MASLFDDIYEIFIVIGNFFTVYSVNIIGSIMLSFTLINLVFAVRFLGFDIDFLVLTLLLVYVAAVSVVFLFVIMVGITLLHFYQKVVSYFVRSILCISLCLFFCFYFYV